MAEDYTPRELADMDEEEARQTLPIAQYERWEQIQDLYEEKADTEAEWEREEETVREVTVSADMEQLGTRVDLYDNDLLVRADPESQALQDALETLEDDYGDIEVEDPDADGEAAFGDVDTDRLDALADHLLGMLDEVIVRWDGTRWAGLPAAQREAILQDARAAWGIDGLMLAWARIAAEIRADREGVVEDLESFLAEAGRGDN